MVRSRGLALIKTWSARKPMVEWYVGGVMLQFGGLWLLGSDSFRWSSLIPSRRRCYL